MRETYVNVHGKDMVHKQPIPLINENAYYNEREIMTLKKIERDNEYILYCIKYRENIPNNNMSLLILCIII